MDFKKIAKIIQNIVFRFFPDTVGDVKSDLGDIAERLLEIEKANAAVRVQNGKMIARLMEDNNKRLAEEDDAVFARANIINTIADL